MSSDTRARRLRSNYMLEGLRVALSQAFTQTKKVLPVSCIMMRECRTFQKGQRVKGTTPSAIINVTRTCEPKLGSWSK